MDSGKFINAYEYDDIYDNNDYLVKSTTKGWDLFSSSRIVRSESIYHNNTAGKPDSVIANSYYVFGIESLSKIYYTYYLNSNKQYVGLTYNYSAGIFTGYNRNTYFHDSANYIQHDSVIYETFTDTSLPATNTNTYSSTKFFNTDHTIREIDNNNYSNYLGDSNINSTKIYYSYSPCSSVLPIALLNFSGERQNNNALLYWQTTNETNASSFDIRRSIYGEHFTTIGSVNASGNSAISKSYTYTDANTFLLTKPKLCYRLAESNNNSIISHSKIISLDITAGKLFVSISPNPIANIIHIYTTTTLNNAMITIIDMKGTILYNAAQNISAGSKISINASAFAKGMYIVTIRSAFSKRQLKIIKE